MKMINYVMKVNYAAATDDSSAWDEPMSEVVEDNVTAEEHAQSIVDFFNRTLRPGERPRKLVSVTETELKTKIMPHQWEKVSLVTEKGGYDRMKCSNCGATGKRYGLGLSGVAIDNKYKKFAEGCEIK
jgi:hypothetical protein